MFRTIHVDQVGLTSGPWRMSFAALLAAMLVLSIWTPLLFFPRAADAATTTVVVPATADTFVHADYPTKNYGGASELVSDAKPDKQGFMRFDTRSVVGQITSAKLRLYVTDGSSAAGGMISRMSNTTWDESSVTYTARPAIDGVQVGLFDQVAPAAWLEYDVTSTVNAASVYSFGISQTGGDDVRFASREHGTKIYVPHLVVMLSSAPTPTPSPQPTPAPSQPAAPSPSPSPTPQPTPAPPTTGACQHTIRLSVSQADGRANFAGVKPGDTVCIEAGTRSKLTLQNFGGTATQPIRFINTGGQVTLKGELQVRNSRYVRLTGSGSSAFRYGIKINPSELINTGVNLRNKTSDIEIDHIEVTGVEIGVNAKTLSTCTASNNDYDYDGDGMIKGDANDVVTQSTFTQYNTIIHDTYIHGVIDEAYYIGANDTLSTGALGCTNPLLRGVQVYNNVLEDFGKDGINVKGTVERCVVHHNRALRGSTNTEANLYQTGAISLAQNTLCDVYSNWVDGNAGPGIRDGGNGGNRIYNNVVLRTGARFNANEGRASGIYSQPAGPINNPIKIWNNTIVGTTGAGIYLGNRSGVVQNNIVASAGSTAIVRASATEDHNLVGALGDIGFVNPSAGDYSLSSASRAIDAGVNLGSQGITIDFLGRGRPQGASHDIGAIEASR